MELLLILLALLCAASTERQDLSEKLLTFPVNTGTSYVSLQLRRTQPITTLSLCMRFFSSLGRHQPLFSLAVPAEPKAFTLTKPSRGVYRLHVNDTALPVYGPDNSDEWNSVCVTWEATSGLTTLWANGKRSDRKVLQPGFILAGAPSVVLGQDQHSYGGGFHNTSFAGDMTEVHLWDRTVSPCEIRHFMEGDHIPAGNLVNWADLDYTATGSVHVQHSDFDKLSCY